MAQKPSIPKGTRDFGPEQMSKRNYIFDTIRSVFKLYGFQPIETPAMENLSTLMGKYGEEGDKLLFKVLNSGDFTKKISDEEKRVPLLGKIPVLGWFFKSKKHVDERSELLIFITPRIINRNNTIINK